ncbi:membrane protein [Knoellia sinensis KCTC 19936]|uniref:Membrane protein n=1 Tax=Knoellia sinensis KCTC 19936 TaxID=1385520 RepID=A0A0A0J5V5_9MICO|nr:DUF2784 domain-containing protein [Knoellia sinensis]KGN30971.1 membrane protein [Knoellia sinensis KCTC 19936]
MAWQAVLADAVMLVHFAFLLFVVLGGFLAWRWPKLIWVHVPAAVWGFATVAFSIRCPLTDVEEWARERAGEEALAGTGFIDHYIEGVLYPERYTAVLQLLAAASVIVSWAGFAWRHRGRVTTLA